MRVASPHHCSEISTSSRAALRVSDTDSWLQLTARSGSTFFPKFPSAFLQTLSEWWDLSMQWKGRTKGIPFAIQECSHPSHWDPGSGDLNNSRMFSPQPLRPRLRGPEQFKNVLTPATETQAPGTWTIQECSHPSHWDPGSGDLNNSRMFSPQPLRPRLRGPEQFKNVLTPATETQAPATWTIQECSHPSHWDPGSGDLNNSRMFSPQPLRPRPRGPEQFKNVLTPATETQAPATWTIQECSHPSHWDPGSGDLNNSRMFSPQPLRPRLRGPEQFKNVLTPATETQAPGTWTIQECSHPSHWDPGSGDLNNSRMFSPLPLRPRLRGAAASNNKVASANGNILKNTTFVPFFPSATSDDRWSDMALTFIQ